MRWSHAGVAIPTTIFEAAICGQMIGVRCRCGHRALVDCYAIWWRFEKKGWGQRFEDARQRFYCLTCSRRQLRRVRPVWVGVVKYDPTVRELNMRRPPHEEWKRAQRRVRT